MKSRPVVLLTGARQTGKSSLLRRLLPDVDYVTFDRLLVAEEAEANPSYFLGQFKGPAILDEIQYVPSLFRELKILIDNDRQNYGRWILTGSQKFNLMQAASESLAGRISILHLETLSLDELRSSGYFTGQQINDYICRGGFPELWANSQINSDLFFENYIQTYLERDLKEIINVSNLRDFQRFVKLCALRAGQILNYSVLAKDTGISPNTAKQWLAALEMSGIIYLLPPFYANIGKRLIKAPKLYFADHGLLSYLLNVSDYDSFTNNPQKGAIWENVVFGELIKANRLVPGRNMFYYRDQNSVEIDFIIEKQGEISLIEAKAAEIVDKRKLNFHKVSPLLQAKGFTVNSILVSLTPEKKLMKLRDYDAINIMHSTLKFG